MKGSTAFVVHCPELSENQRIVVVGGCPELGGWELGDALSLTPAPCGRPWWVSSEVEVNLSECPLSVSEELEHRVETDGNVEAVRVSALNFRLVAIPNDGDIDQMPDLHNLVRLEPLKRGDFRVVRLVGAPPFPDYSSVGERGDNTIRVGVKGVGEQQTKEVVGISVEWGVPESVQLALLPRPSNSQTEHSQRESVNDCSVLSDHRSAAACPTSSEGGGQEESGRLNSMDGQGGKLGVSVCPSQTADAVRGSDTQRGGVEGENRVRESGTEETQVKKPIAHSDSSCRPADANTDSRSFPCHSRSPTFLLPPRDSSRPPRQGEEEAGRMRVAPLKRRLSESVLTQFENNDGKEMCAERMVAVGAGSGGKHRRLTVTLSPSEAALLSSDSLREREDPIVEGRVVVSGNECRGGEQGEVKRDRRGNILCPHGRIRCVCKDCGGKGICEHGRIRSRCKECGGGNICEHGRRRHICKECGGKSICEHGRERNKCKDCGGKSICEHGRKRCECKECGGASICEHGRIRSRCKDCGGKGICEHGRQRSNCRDCGGKGICEHGRIRCRCKDCGGKSICEHGRIRCTCKECGGKSICEHGRKRCGCKECGGKSICEHGKQRSNCRDCGGGSVCEHGRIRSRCKDCGGKSICEHGRQRYKCKDCGGKGICEHGRHRYYCKDCRGKGICEHGRERRICKDCGGKGICIHRKQHQRCQACKQASSLPP